MSLHKTLQFHPFLTLLVFHKEQLSQTHWNWLMGHESASFDKDAWGKYAYLERKTVQYASLRADSLAV